MILLVDVCKNYLHRKEFINPISDILLKQEIPFDIIHYSKINSKNKKKILSKYHRIIICGTSLFDSDYSKNIKKFNWLKEDIVKDKPILGICAGMQILCIVHGSKLEKNLEVGLVKVHFNKNFELSKNNSEREAYAIHNYAVLDDLVFRKKFDVYAKSFVTINSSNQNSNNQIKKNTIKECIQAVKHKENKHFGTLFHPEVRNKDLIVNFLSV